MDALFHGVERQDGHVRGILIQQAQGEHIVLQLEEGTDFQALTGQLGVEQVAVGVCAVHQDKGVVDQLGQTDALARGERVIAVCDHHDLLLGLKDLDELRVEHLRIERVNEVELVFEQLVLERGDHVGVQAHHHMGEALTEGRDNVGE